MLRRLLVKNFLLIREAELEFSPRLNVLTGETGTGKSILLGALGLALGGRGSPKWIGAHGADLRIEVVFRSDRPARRMVRAMGIPTEGEELILSREIHPGGVGRCFVNGHRVLQRALRKLGAQLVEIHGQRAEERFRIPEVQRDLLDLFGGHGEQRRRVRELFRDLRIHRQALEEHRAKMARLVEEEDWIRFQLQEIEQIDPAAGEIEQLRERAGSLREGVRQSEWLMLAEQILNAREGAVLESLETLDDRATSLPPEAPEWQEIRAQVKGLVTSARELYRQLSALRSHADEDCNDLPVIEERLERLEGLERKHRKPLLEILDAAGAMRESLLEVEENKEREQAIRAELARAEAALGEAVSELRSARQKSAGKLMRALERELASLGMQDCALHLALEPLAAIREGLLTLPGGSVVGSAGAERVRLEIQTNRGAGFHPLGEIASGGEMARIALGLRVVLGDRGRALLTVFDEIDAGLGATAARDVAKRLQRVSMHRQVLLVTHVPVIAASAERHFRVWKQAEGATNTATARALSEPERVAEVARMLSGDGADSRARAHAAALLTKV
ncbi:MAG: AAA family ATPase [Candidatus Eisenbacteria sp.]|nr:AAA family ATPase [Candidatus Eisenbacteria bacterium]